MRLIDADALKELRHNVIQGLVKFDGNEYDLIDKCPTVDAVPVVRCGQCRYERPEVDAYTQETIGYWCSLHDIGSVQDSDFCSYGEHVNPFKTCRLETPNCDVCDKLKEGDV